MSLVVNLYSGSLLNILERNPLEADDTCSGNSKSALHIFLYNSLSFYPLKGNRPQSKANIKTPNAQASAGGPQYSFLLTISGAIYEGVPQKSLIFLSFGMQVENPKSISFT